MSFRVTGLGAAPFQHLFGLPDAALAARGARRYVVDACPGFPDRIGLRDLEPGETALLVNHTHQAEHTPYRASHAIYIREGGGDAYDAVDEVPESLRSRLLSLRVFDAAHMMVDADVLEGSAADAAIRRMLDNPGAAYIHAHYARRGCYAACFRRA